MKFDLTKYDQACFDRLRGRVQALCSAGVYLFSGESLLRFRCPTDGYPLSGQNNVNGVDDGYRDGLPATAVASLTMTTTNAITDLQDAYVTKTVDTLNDLPNVLWIVSEEAPAQSTWWNDHLISFVRVYEKGKPCQHPIGYATLENPTDSILYNSDADWVAPWAKVSPERSCGTGNPACKVNVNDSDHSYFGMWNDTPQVNRDYAWENFRNNLGYLLNYSRRLNLANVNPRSSLCSTKYCLAQTPSVGAEYLVYAPSGGLFTMDLSAMANSRMLAVEWFNPATGTAVSQRPIPTGSSSQTFSPPFSGDAVLYLVDTEGHNGSPTYSTPFDGDENPLSERGRWINNGLDWTKIRKQVGIAHGTQTGTNAGNHRYDDSYAHLSGFPPDQEAWAQVQIAKPDASCHQELEILLRWASSAHSTTGYECFARCVNDDSSYVQIVRWEGPLGKFMYLADRRGANFGLKDGDPLRASIIGNVITVYINGVEKAQVTDDTHKTGNPGIGTFLSCDVGSGAGSNAHFGFRSLTARGLGGGQQTKSGTEHEAQ